MTTLLSGQAFLEGPRWRGDALNVSDFYTGEVLRVSLDGRVSVVAHVPGRPSGLGWLPDGTMVAVSMLHRRLLRLEPDRIIEMADLSAMAPFEINDMVVGLSGHVYVGQAGFDRLAGAPPTTAPLLRVDPEGNVAVAAEDLSVANGMVITEDERTLLVAESFADAITAFTVIGDGSLVERRIWAELPAGPDGICLDAEGALWVGCPHAHRLLRVLEGGEITDEVAVDQLAVACALGGEDGRTLFMLIAPTGQPDEALARREARIDVIEVAVPGVERP